MKKWCCVFVLLCISHPGFAAFKPRTIVSFAAGSYLLDDGDHQLVGSRSSIGLKHLRDENWSWFATLEQGSAAESYQLAGASSTYLIQASTTGLNGGVEWRVGLDEKQSILPFIGFGANALNYQIQDSYSGSSIGNISGTGLGPVVKVGVRFSFGEHFTLIPSYQYSSMEFKTASGSRRTLVSSGTFIGLVAVF